MLIAIAIAEEIQGLKSFASSESFEVLSFPWIWQEVWVWTVVNLLSLTVPQELTPSSGFLVACMPKSWARTPDSPQIKSVQLKLLAKVKENPEAQNLQNFDAILRNPWISPAMAMAMSIYRTLCVLVFKWACKTILGPPKHVLHLDWSVYVTFKTIKIALKVEL